MKKTKLTRTLLAAVSVVALSAVMYGCTGDGAENDLTATQADLERAEMERDAALAAQAAAEARADAAEAAAATANAAAAAAAAAQATAEAERDTANAAAAAAAMAQADAEAAQAAAEMAQADAEAAQATAEAAQMTAEAAAAVSEQARMAAETGRTMAEAARAAAAAAQATAEAERDAANAAAAAAETARMAAEQRATEAEAAAQMAAGDQTAAEMALATARAAAADAEARATAAEMAQAEAEAARDAALAAQAEAEEERDAALAARDDLQQRDDDAAAAAAVASAGALYEGLGNYFGDPMERDLDGDGSISTTPADGETDDIYGAEDAAPKSDLVALTIDGEPKLVNNPTVATDDFALSAKEDGELMLGDWTGQEYEGASLPGQIPYEYMAVVYSTQGNEGGTPFFHLYGSATEDTNGYLEFGDQTADTDAFTGDDDQVRGFPTAGTTSYPVLAEVDGTYDGAPGTYRCVATAGCTAVALADGGFTLGATTPAWRFYPDAGAEVPRPDSTYQSFGWWLSKNVTPDQDDATAYVIRVPSSALQSATFDGTVLGTAEYSGHAVGKYAIYSALLNQGEAGHFTADAALTADFGDGTDLVTVSGLIDNFMTGDGAKSWTVSLAGGAFPSADTTGAGTFSGTTTWRIAGVPSVGSGDFGGMFHNNPHATLNAQPATYIPDEVGGTFDAQYESATGRMIGAFAATRD